MFRSLSDADEYMPDFMALLAEGIRTNMGDVVDGIEALAGSFRDTVEDGLDLSSFSMPDLAESVSAGSGSVTNNENHTVNLGGIQVVVNGYNAQNDNELARMVADKINEMLNEESAVFR